MSIGLTASGVFDAVFGRRESYKVYLMDSPTLSMIPGFKIKNAQIAHVAQIARHPTEDGKEVVDHKIIDPRVVQVDGYCADKGTYAMILQMFEDRRNLYGIQVKEMLVENCVFGEFVPSRDSKVLSAIPVSFTMNELLEVPGTTGLESSSVKEPRDASTINRGFVPGATPNAESGNSMISSNVGGK